MVPESGLTWRGNPNELIASYAVVTHQSYFKFKAVKFQKTNSHPFRLMAMLVSMALPLSFLPSGLENSLRTVVLVGSIRNMFVNCRQKFLLYWY